MENLQQLTNDELVNVLREITGRLENLKKLDDNEKLVYTPREAAKALGVGMNTIYKLLKEDDFPSYTLAAGKYYVSKKGLEEWVQNQHK